MSLTTQAISTINQTLQENASAKLVYSDPIRLDNKIVLPVAKITFGYGGGGITIDPNNPASAEHSEQGGVGGGGGIIAHPTGVFEITETDTRFIPVTNKAVWGLSLIAAFILGSRFGARKARR